jgi:hypothetical protein
MDQRSFGEVCNQGEEEGRKRVGRTWHVVIGWLSLRSVQDCMTQDVRERCLE